MTTLAQFIKQATEENALLHDQRCKEARELRQKLRADLAECGFPSEDGWRIEDPANPVRAEVAVTHPELPGKATVYYNPVHRLSLHCHHNKIDIQLSHPHQLLEALNNGTLPIAK